MVGHQPSKLRMWVRFPSPAPIQGYGQEVKARDFDSLIRWFKSSYPCHITGYGGIGRHVGFRFQWLTLWGFKSPYPDHGGHFLLPLKAQLVEQGNLGK